MVFGWLMNMTGGGDNDDDDGPADQTTSQRSEIRSATCHVADHRSCRWCIVGLFYATVDKQCFCGIRRQ